MTVVAPIRKSKTNPPPFQDYYIYALMVFLGFLASDLATTYVRDTMLPTKAAAPSRAASKYQGSEQKSRQSYTVITKRNFFSSDGVIPEPLKAKDGGPEFPSGEAQPTSLPIKLVGTIVHVNAKNSVASILLNGSSKVLAYKVSDKIESMAKVESIERKKVIFLNLNNNRREYVEIKDDIKISFGPKDAKSSTTSNKDVSRDGNQFQVKKASLQKYISDLPNLLNQASGMFNFVNGRPEGYKILDVDPNSVIAELGILPNDVIREVNGQLLDSPARAMELFNELKSSQSVEITINRNGSNETLNYNIGN